MSLEGLWFEFVIRLCHEVEVTSDLEFLVSFGMSLVSVCHEIVGDDIYSLEGAQAKLKIWKRKVPPHWV